MVELEFKALNQREYRIAIVLIVLAILIPALLFMIFVVLNNLNKIPRSFLIGILGILGIISFFILALIVNKTLGKKYELTFNETELFIKSNKTEVINYYEINSIRIHNNTDYSKIVIHKKDGSDFKLFVGMANLLNNKDILEPASILDSALEKKFRKEVTKRKGIDIIIYKIDV